MQEAGQNTATVTSLGGIEQWPRVWSLHNDPVGEFCGQHHATLTESDTVVLFDNGVLCGGPRKNIPRFTRVVEYVPIPLNLP